MNDAQRDSYYRDGYFVARGLFSERELAELRAAMAAILAPLTRNQRSKDVGFDPWPRGTPGDAINPHRAVYVNDLQLRHPRLDAHMRSAQFAEIFCRLWDSDIKAFQCASTLKPNQYNAEYLGWHQDMPDYVPLSSDRNGCAITYLYDMGPGSGGTSVVAGSHKGALLERVWTPVDDWPTYLKRRGMRGFDPTQATVIAPEFRAGDALIFHSSVYHAANSNFTDQSKISLINVYQAEDCIDIERRNQFKAADLPITRNRVPLPPA